MSFRDLFSYSIILNSSSPRRRQLLEDMGFDIRVVKTTTEETYPDSLSLEQIPLYLAEKKGRAFVQQIQAKEILLSSDTMVFLDKKPLGKPANSEEAFKMLSHLSGKRHSVISACNLRSQDRNLSFYESTEVYFKNLSAEEITHYIDTYKPFDKAGAYGIQEWIGMIGIEKIEGDFYNVMGLPTVSLFEKLKEITTQ